MSVLFETSLGDIVVDLEVELCPKTSENFLKLCKIYYYNFCTFFNVQKDFIAQTGDPSNLGTGGESIYSKLKPQEGNQENGERYFTAELGPQKINKNRLNHTKKGTLSMVVSKEGKCSSQFILTLSQGKKEDLDNKHIVFGKVIEGFETLDKINNSLVDQQGRPLRDIKLRHVILLDDPFDDPIGISIPDQSPIEPTYQQNQVIRISDDEELDEELDLEVVEARRREREARSQALTLEMVGDLPFAEVSPPENILFVCKLNSITRSEDLELIFSRFGTILSCQVITDSKTGDSLQYAFIEFDKREDAERAYFKMNGVLIDDRRIHVDFSQSVSKLHSDWVFKKTGRRIKPTENKQNKKKSNREVTSHPYHHNTNKDNERNSKYDMKFDDVDLIKKNSHHSRNLDSKRDYYKSERSSDSHSNHYKRRYLDHNKRRSRSPVNRRSRSPVNRNR